MTAPVIRQINQAELDWIESQLAAAREFVATYSPQRQALGVESLDAAWTAWMATAPEDVDSINHAINCVGIPFGSLLVATGEFEWCIASDDWGTDLAVVALRGTGDVLVYPADFVSKRWETPTADFLLNAFPQIIEHVEATRRDWSKAGL